jgi:hypothetical protein
MKYEEWIKYEELRKKMLEINAWVLLEPDLLKQSISAGSKPKENEKPRLLSAILQVFNPRSI